MAGGRAPPAGALESAGALGVRRESNNEAMVLQENVRHVGLVVRLLLASSL